MGTRRGERNTRRDDTTRFAGGRRRDSRAGSSRRTFRLWLPKVDCTAASDSRRYMHVSSLYPTPNIAVAPPPEMATGRPHCSVPGFLAMRMPCEKVPPPMKPTV